MIKRIEKTADRGDFWFQKYDSIHEMKEAVSEFEHDGNARLWEEYESDTRGKSWLGVNSIGDVIKCVESGWPEGLEQIKSVLENIEAPELPVLRRKRARGSFGDEVDMQRVYAGDLDRAWSTLVREEENSKYGYQTATLLVDVGSSGGYTSQQRLWAGACAIAISDALEKSGRPVRIVAYNTCSDLTPETSRGSGVFVTVKEQGQRIDKEKLAATLCLAGFHRYYIFKAKYNLPELSCSGMGFPVHSWIPDFYRPFLSGHVIHISGIFDQETAQNFVNKKLDVTQYA